MAPVYCRITSYNVCYTKLLRLPLHEEVVLLCLANAGIFQEVPVKEIKKYRSDLMEYIQIHHRDLLDELDQKKEISDDLKNKIIQAALDFGA